MVASVTPKGLNRLLYFSRFSAAMPREDEAQVAGAGAVFFDRAKPRASSRRMDRGVVTPLRLSRS